MSYQLRYFDQTRGSFFLFGPRGTGKSTWLKNTFPQAGWIDLLDAEKERMYSARPERLKDFLALNRKRGTIVIDEIQRVPELLPVVHHQIEADKSLQFILTGSSARKLKKAGVDLLAGRAIKRQMHPFMAGELGPGFNLENNLALGMVPLVLFSETPANTLKGYIDLYIQEEVKTEGLVRRLDDFNRFLEIISFSHGGQLNVAEIARECLASRNTVESYITILEDLLLAVRLPVFRRKAKRATAVHSKFYFFDCGVFKAVRPAGPLDDETQINGPALEGLVMQHLRGWIDYRCADMKLYYWRTRGGSEVDFVLYGSEGFYAIEVKNGSIVRNSDMRGLKTFFQDYPQAMPILLYRGSETIMRDGIVCIPVDMFLQSLHPQKELPLE
jgi:uncharacterized protein